MENVKGMQTMQKGKIFDEIISIFSDGELNEGAPYNIFHKIVKAVDFGIPQKRERLIIIGTTIMDLDFEGIWEETKKSILLDYPDYFEPTTVRDAIGNLPVVTESGVIPNPIPQNQYQRYLACDNVKLTNHLKELKADKEVIRSYYRPYISSSALNLVIDIYDRVEDYILSYFQAEPGIDPTQYIPGHGMYIVSRAGNVHFILDNIRQKIRFQIGPYLKDLYAMGFLKSSPDSFIEQVNLSVNVGVAGLCPITSITKKLVRQNTNITTFSLEDSRNYYFNTIVPAKCIDFRGMMECIIDALILNGVFPHDGLDPWTMLETVMLDDEYEVYMDELAADNKYLFHIFYDQPLIRLPQNANIDAEILFALSYINSCHALCKKGLKKTLIYHDENLTAKIRGKIDVSKNIKHNTARGRSDKFYCSYVDFTDDNIENRIVKAALLKSKKILKEKFSSEASVNGKINFCLNSLRHVKVTNISNTDINSSNVGGLYSYYKPAIQQARAILSLNFQSHNEKNGENEKGFVYTIPYTINMETLFEYYARTELKKALKGSEYRVEQYSKKLYLQKDIDNVDDAEKGIHLMSFCIPDIIIYKEDKPVVVIDAKYKLSGRPDRSDSHQLLSYVLLTGADRCGFVLPGEKTEVKEMVSTGDNYLPLAPRILRYYELLLGSKSDSSELQKVLQ